MRKLGFVTLYLFCACLFPVSSAHSAEPYRSAVDIYTPQPVQPLPGTTAGVVAIPEYNEKEITIYQGSEDPLVWVSDTFMSLMLLFSKANLPNSTKLSVPQTSTVPTHFTSISIWKWVPRSIAKAAVDTIEEIQREAKIGIFEYLLIELISSYGTQKVLWRTPRSTKHLIPTDNTMEWGRVRSASRFNCKELYNLATFQDAFRAQAVLPSAVTRRGVGRVLVSTFLQHLFNFSLEQTAGAKGSLKQVSVTTTHGRSRQSPALLRFTIGGNASGSVSTTVTSTETDTRERWMNRKAFQEATNSYIHRIGTSTWCEEGDKNCNASRMEDRLLQMFGDIFKGQTLKILARASEVSDAMKQYMLIEDAEEVERLRQASMNPSFSSDVGVNVDCEKLKEAAVAVREVREAHHSQADRNKTSLPRHQKHHPPPVVWIALR